MINLKDIAEKATKSHEWGKIFRTFKEEWPDGRTYQTVAASGPLHKMSNEHNNPLFADMKYLETFNPATVLAMLEVIDSLEPFFATRYPSVGDYALMQVKYLEARAKLDQILKEGAE